MAKRMLIDATHPEETRVVILNGTRLEEFDFETSTKKQFKGNIYLAKVTRVEPSLQAAFVEFGGNRHGFLAFSEIHPDYYQIPVADRMALIAAQTARAMADEEDDIDSIDMGTAPAKRSRRSEQSSNVSADASTEAAPADMSSEEEGEDGDAEEHEHE